MNDSKVQCQISSLYSKYINDLGAGEQRVSDTRMHELVVDLDKDGILLDCLDWDEWYHNSYMVDRPEYIADASLYECQLLLTAMTRLEKFSSGVLNNMRRQGVLLAIIERFETLSFKKVM